MTILFFLLLLLVAVRGEENVVVTDGDRIVSFSEHAPHISIYTAESSLRDSAGGSLHAELTIEEACFGERCLRMPTFDLGLPERTGLVIDNTAAKRRLLADGDFHAPEAHTLSMRMESMGGEDSVGAAIGTLPQISVSVYFVETNTRFEVWGERIETHANTLVVVTRVLDVFNASALNASEPATPFSLRLRWTGADQLLHTQNYVGKGRQRDAGGAGSAGAGDGAQHVSSSAQNRTAFLQLGKTALLDGIYVQAGTRVALHDRTAICDVLLPHARSAGYIAMIGIDAPERRPESPHLTQMRLVATAVVVVGLLVAGIAVIMLRLRREMRHGPRQIEKRV